MAGAPGEFFATCPGREAVRARLPGSAAQPKVWQDKAVMHLAFVDCQDGAERDGKREGVTPAIPLRRSNPFGRILPRKAPPPGTSSRTALARLLVLHPAVLQSRGGCASRRTLPHSSNGRILVNQRTQNV